MNFKQFVNMNESKSTLDTWKDLMDKYDLNFFTEFQTKTKSDLKQMREDWKAMRRVALSKLNQDLNKQGKSGQLLNIDVPDEELYPYIDDKSEQFSFFKYSRILDFSDGYKPKNLVLIKKDSPTIKTQVDTTIIDVIKQIPQQKQVQYDLNRQLRELRVAANKLGLYDAADFLRRD